MIYRGNVPPASSRLVECETVQRGVALPRLALPETAQSFPALILTPAMQRFAHEYLRDQQAKRVAYALEQWQCSDKT
jgi:hypothetical protein